MKRFLKATVFASILLVSTTTLFAEGAHSHNGISHVHEKISETKAIVIAKSMSDGLVKKGTIDKSWEKIDASKVEKKVFGKNEEWIISFNNPLMKENQQTLYVFVDLYGEVTGANYSGK